MVYHYKPGARTHTLCESLPRVAAVLLRSGGASVKEDTEGLLPQQILYYHDLLEDLAEQSTTSRPDK